MQDTENPSVLRGSGGPPPEIFLKMTPEMAYSEALLGNIGMSYAVGKPRISAFHLAGGHERVFVYT